MSEYKFHGITGMYHQQYNPIHNANPFFRFIGPSNIFGFPYCENDRLWRKMLAITPDRYMKAVEQQFDECHNAFVKPKRPVYLDLL